MKQAVLVSTMLMTACMQAHPSKPTQEKPPTENQVMCTMDAQQCADGGWVGRSGPNCEFACPAAVAK